MSWIASRGAAADRRHPRARCDPSRRRARARARPSASAPSGSLRCAPGPSAAGQIPRDLAALQELLIEACAARSPSASRATSRARSAGWPRCSARSRARSPARWSTSRWRRGGRRPGHRPPGPAAARRVAAACCSPSSAATGTRSRSRSSTSTGSGGSTTPTAATPATGCWPRSPAVLRRQLRDVDQAFRLEEDEFAVLAPHTDADRPGADGDADRRSWSRARRPRTGPRIAIASGVVDCPDDGTQRRAPARERRGGDLRREGGGRRRSRAARAPAPMRSCKIR